MPLSGVSRDTALPPFPARDPCLLPTPTDRLRPAYRRLHVGTNRLRSFSHLGDALTFFAPRPRPYGLDTSFGMPADAGSDDSLSTGCFVATQTRCAAAGLIATAALRVPGPLADNASQVVALPATMIAVHP